MEFTSPVAIAYCIDNQDKATPIKEYLAPSITFKDVTAGRDGKESIAQQLAGFNGPIVLLISDNFLRSTMCMHQSLQLMNERSQDILPVVISGTRTDLESGVPTVVDTSFERVSDIIQYINFWQDRYLDLRRQKREDPSLDEDGFNQHLKIVRDISSEAGEFLRLLRSSWHLTELEFSHNDYEQLYIFLDEQELWESFHAFRQANPSSLAPAEASPEEEEIGIELQDIPGVSLLTDAVPDPEDSKEEPADEEEVAPVEEEPIAMVEQPEEPQAESLPEKEEELEVEEQEEDGEPEEPDTGILIRKAWTLADQGDGKSGLSLLSSGVENYPADTQLRYHYALMLAEEHDDLTDARDQVDILIQAEPEHEDILFLAGELADLQGEAEHARHYYEQVLSINKKHADAWYKLGLVTLANFQGEQEEAMLHLKKAVKYDKENTDAAYRLALLYQETGVKDKKVSKLLKGITKQEPDHAFAHYDLALVLHRQGKFEKAKAYYEKAVVLNAEFQTPENDAAFLTPVPDAIEETIEEEIPVAPREESTEDLKERIAQLEAQLNDQNAVAAPQPSPGIALVSGATSGIGLATSRALAAAGYRVIITGRRVDRLQELQQSWEEAYSTKILPLVFDIRDPQAVQDAIASLPPEWSKINLLVNNAGKAKGLDYIHEGQLEHWEEMIDTNIKGLLYLTRAISPGMVARGSGHIINLCSTAGKEVYPRGNVYCATKHAVDALTKSMRIDLHTHGVRVSQVCPAHVEETEFALVRFDGNSERARIYDDFQPLRSQDVAETIVYIAQQPPHVNILDVVMQGTQQASSLIIDRSGRDRYSLEEE